MMEPPYNFPQNEYALAILTNAAMRSSETINASKGSQANPTTDYHELLAAGITNLRNDDNHETLLHGISAQSQLSHSRSEGFSSVYSSTQADPSRDDMAALRYQQGGRAHPNPYMTSGFYGMGSNINAASLTDLGILNSETYDDGRLDMSAQRARDSYSRAKVQQEGVMPLGVTEVRGGTDSDEFEKVAKGRRKRKVESVNGDDDEEARKKARGRPRVDPKDETAADRRRTQIRMAQRAYRHRKETTITSLEKQVQDLRGTNEEMSNIFISLYDFAVGKGLLQREPEFGQQLQSTTQRFLALVKATSNDDESHEDTAKEVEKTTPESIKKTKATRTTAKEVQGEQPRMPEQPSQSDQPWGGYTLMKEDSPVEEILMDFSQHPYQNGARSNELQVITRPTEDNASFPFDFTDFQTYRVEVPTPEDFSQYFLPQSQPRLPSTLSYNEFTFARRIQRLTLERAYRLISAKNPPQQRFNDVFGLTLMYESKANIKHRIEACLDSTSQDSLSQWKAPFVHIGGAGTFYPGEFGGDLMPKFRTGYSMGPFSPNVTQVQELMQDDMRCTLPGYEGEFFDANDVEGYLRGRGLDIPATAEYVTAEIDISELSGPKSGSNAADISPRTPQSPADKIMMESRLSYGLDFNNREPKSFPFPILSHLDWKTPADAVDPALAGSTELQTPPLLSGQASPGRQLVTVNVNLFLTKIMDHAVCLGRTSGFRPKDVNNALIAAIQTGI